ncbi:MAG: hypothetical protein V3T72_07565 [Thermoanaerobaculia bacterium]
MPGEDRRTALCQQQPPRLTGIDFIQVVDPDLQTLLRVFFIIDPDDLDDPMVANADLPVSAPPSTVSIVSVSGGAEVTVTAVTWREIFLDGQPRTVLEVETEAPGDFSRYRLTIDDPPPDGPRVDRFFNDVEFSFKQGCPSDLDCRITSECPPEEMVDFPVDYLARDFVSLRNALLDFAAQRYPQWSEKIEADVGVMLAEVMAALGDELSYVQDRYAREAYLETASQRRSLRRHTRLVDYPIHDGRSATTWLAVTAAPGGHTVAAGARVWAVPEGEAPIPFEVGEGLRDDSEFWIHSAWNAMPAHLPDTSVPCLPIGSTEIFLAGHLEDHPPPAEDLPPEEFWQGRWMILAATPEDPSEPRRRHLIRVVEVEFTEDPLCLDEDDQPIEITRVRWQDDQALPFELCLADTVALGNVVPATAGETFTEFFVIDANDDLPDDPEVAVAVERQGPLNELTGECSPIFLHSLRQSEARGLGWVGELRNAMPELELEEVPAAAPLSEPQQIWHYRRSLLSSESFNDHYTLDDGTWRRVIGFRRIGEVIEHLDYASGDGFTVRFGDGGFGRLPADGTVFRARYRTGDGSGANLAADTVTVLTDPDPDAPPEPTLDGVAAAVTNPFAITSGVDPEAPEVVKQLAPEAFQAETWRAVRDEDYREIAERLPWVQRAGASARWTGSWLTEFVTADPLGEYRLAADRRRELENLMDCVRQVGREVHVRDPMFLPIDLEVEICVEPFAYPGQVKERVKTALVGLREPPQAFFHPDRFTFGTPLRRASLEAAIQRVPGVRGVEEIRIRVRGVTDWRVLKELVLETDDDRILMLRSDPRLPEQGSLRIRTITEAQA